MPVKWPAGIFGGRNLKADLYINGNQIRKESDFSAVLANNNLNAAEIAKQYLTDCQGSSCDAMDEIIQKINEVLNEVEHN